MDKTDQILDNIKEFRKAKGLTQMDVSERIGLAKNNYGKVENGHIELTVKRLYEIAGILGVSVTTLLGENVGDSEKVGQLERELAITKAEKAKSEESLNTINQLFNFFMSAIKRNEPEIKAVIDRDSPTMIELEELMDRELKAEEFTELSKKFKKQ